MADPKDVGLTGRTGDRPIGGGLSAPQVQVGTSASPGAGQDAGTLANVKDKARDLAATVADKAESAWETTRQQTQAFAATVSDQAEHAWDRTRQQAQEWADVASVRAADALETTTDFIRRYPIQTLLAVFGIGVFLGRGLRSLTSERRSRSYNY